MKLSQEFKTRKKEKKIFLGSFTTTEDVHLYKEPGEIPYYFSKIFNYSSLMFEYKGIQQNFRTVKLYGVSKRLSKISQFISILKVARFVDILYLIHISPRTYLKMLAYKLGGGKGKIYVKCDMGPLSPNKKEHLRWDNMDLKRKIFYRLFKNLPDIYTIESNKSYERIKRSYFGDLIDKGKFYQLPNGFDPDVLEECGIIRRPVSEKEKIIITVGRLGTYQKNTELLLDVLNRVDLKDWKVYLIGPIEKSFEDKIQEFYRKSPEKRKSIVFSGTISQRELYDYYNRARVFMLTSRNEGFSFALVEAAYMKNYIISTDVGGAEDVLTHTGGYIVNSIDSPELKMSEKLQEIINLSNDELNKLVPENDRKEMSWQYLLMNNEGIQKLVR